MKLVTFEVTTPLGKYHRIGAVIEKQVVDLTLGCTKYLSEVENDTKAYQIAKVRIPPKMIEFFEGGENSSKLAQRTLEYIKEKLQKENEVIGPKGEKILYQRSEIKVLAPVPKPNSLRDGAHFEQHYRQAIRRLTGQEGKITELWYQIPNYFRHNPDLVIGPDETALWPKYSEQLDYELEYGIFIGKKGINISKKEAQNYIAGYTIFCDYSARDIQKKERARGTPSGKSKNWETSMVMGPWLVTPDEIPDPYNLKLVTRVNGEIWAEGHSSQKGIRFPELIEYISQEETLYPGDFIASGTPGNGCGLELDRWIKPGDVIELEVEGIGVLKTKIEKM